MAIGTGWVDGAWVDAGWAPAGQAWDNEPNVVVVALEGGPRWGSDRHRRFLQLQDEALVITLVAMINDHQS